MPLFSPQRRDANEREIIDALRRVGAYVDQMDKSAGFDLLVAYSGRIYALEVKQSGGSLTAGERRVLAELVNRGCPAYVVQTPDDALSVIGAIW